MAENIPAEIESAALSLNGKLSLLAEIAPFELSQNARRGFALLALSCKEEIGIILSQVARELS